MRKVIKIFSACALSALLALSSACNKNGGTTTTNRKEVPEREVVIADYETFDDIYATNPDTTQYSFEGGYKITNEAKNVISGNGSLEIKIRKFVTESWSGYAEDTGLCAQMTYDVFSTPKNKDKGFSWGFDWKYLSALSVDVRNPNDFDLRISIFILTHESFPFNFGTRTVSAGSTATVSANVNRYFMQNEFNDNVSHIIINISYDKEILANGELYYPESTLYLDNIVVKVNENPVYDNDGSAIIDKTFATTDEILNFSDPDDLSYMRETGCSYVKESDNEWDTKTFFNGTGSAYYYNTNPKYIKGEGNVGSLEWRITPTMDKVFTRSNYAYNTNENYAYYKRLTGITVVSDFLNYYNFSQIQKGNVKIAVDVYNAAPFAKDVFFGICDMNGDSSIGKYGVHPWAYGETGFADEIYKLQPFTWTTLEITDFSYLDLSAGLARLRLNTSLMDVWQEISLYVNNLRIVYEEA